MAQPRLLAQPRPSHLTAHVNELFTSSWGKVNLRTLLLQASQLIKVQCLIKFLWSYAGHRDFSPKHHAQRLARSPGHGQPCPTLPDSSPDAPGRPPEPVPAAGAALSPGPRRRQHCPWGAGCRHRAAPRHPAPRQGDTQEASLGTPHPSRQRATMKLPWDRGKSCRTGSTDPGSTGMAGTGCPRWRNGGYSLEPADPEQKNVFQRGLTMCLSNSHDHP